MKTFEQFITERHIAVCSECGEAPCNCDDSHGFMSESTKVVDDGPIMNVHHNDKHIGNIMKSSADKKLPFKAYSKHWDMKRLHSSKKAAVNWLVQTHKTAMNEDAMGGGVAVNAVGAGNVQGIGFGAKGEPGGRKAILSKMFKRKMPNVVAKVPT